MINFRDTFEERSRRAYESTLMSAVNNLDMLPDANLGRSFRNVHDTRLLETFWLFSWAARARYVRLWLKWVASFDLGLIIFDAVIDPALIPLSIAVRGIGLTGLLLIVVVLWSRPRRQAALGASFVFVTTGVITVAGALGSQAGGALFEQYLTAGLFTVATAVIIFPVALHWTIGGLLAATGVHLTFLLVSPYGDRSALLMWGFYALAVLSLTTARHAALNGMWKNFMSRTADARNREEVARLNLELAAMASTDPLTNLANRRSATNYLNALWSHCNEVRNSSAILMVDIDRFKALNDSLGHATGDACIRSVATAITSILESQDLVARYGGEEFLVVLPNVGAIARAIEVAEQVREAVESLQLPNPRADHPAATVSVSIGVAMVENGASHEQVTAWADSALYEAKRNGRNRVDAWNVNPAQTALLECGSPALSPAEDRLCAELNDLRIWKLIHQHAFLDD